MSTIHDDVGTAKASDSLCENGLQQRPANDPGDRQAPINSWVKGVKFDIPTRSSQLASTSASLSLSWGPFEVKMLVSVIYRIAADAARRLMLKLTIGNLETREGSGTEYESAVQRDTPIACLAITKAVDTISSDAA